MNVALLTTIRQPGKDTLEIDFLSNCGRRSCGVALVLVYKSEQTECNTSRKTVSQSVFGSPSNRKLRMLTIRVGCKLLNRND